MANRPPNLWKKNVWKKYLQPRLWLFIWGGLGALALAVILVAALIPQPGGPAGMERPQSAKEEKFSKLLHGDVARFEPAFPSRGAPENYFDGPEGPVSLQQFRGQVVLVNLWATWCPPCVHEMPSLDALAAKLADQPFRLVAIASGPQGAVKPQDFMVQHNLQNITLYTDEDLDFSRNFAGGKGLPLSILYDKRGREIGRIEGAVEWTSPEAVELIEAVIEGRHP